MNDFHPTSSRRVTDRPFADNRRLLHQLVPIAPVVVLLMVRGGILAKDSEPKADIDQKIQAVLQADDNYRAHLAYRALFKASGAAGLSALKLHGNDGIAIQAAWEEVKLTVPEKKPEQAVPLDRHKLNWFLGFLEGRARVQAPAWWAEMLRNAGAHSRDDIYAGQLKESRYHEAGLDSALAPRDTTLRRESGKIVLRVGNQSCPIPEDQLKKTDHGKVFSSVSGLLIRERCYFAVHWYVGYPYRLVCLDRTSGNILWKTDVLSTAWGSFEGGPFEFWVAVTEQEKRIVLFGAGSGGLHVEAFRTDNGHNLFRFSSSY